jgi:hypothetical protein
LLSTGGVEASAASDHRGADGPGSRGFGPAQSGGSSQRKQRKPRCFAYAFGMLEPWANLPPQTSGIYLAVSEDLVKWSEQFKLVSDYTQRVLGKPIVLAPPIVFDQDNKASGWLIYGYSPKYSTEQLSNVGTPVYLVGRRITFDRVQR